MNPDRQTLTLMLAIAVFMTLGIFGGCYDDKSRAPLSEQEQRVLAQSIVDGLRASMESVRDSSAVPSNAAWVLLRHKEYLRLNNVLVVRATDHEWTVIRDAFPTNVVQSTNILVDLRREQ